MKSHLIIFAVVLLVTTTGAFADQQAWVARATAERAAALLPVGTTARLFCAPCGDATWTPARVVEVGMRHTGTADLWQVHLNNEEIDLAYTYVESGGAWQNLALLLGLEASGVPPFLDGEGDADPADALAAAELELEHLEAALAGSVPAVARRLEWIRSAWERYRDAEAELEVTITGSTEAGARARLRLTESRIAELQALLELDP